MNGIWLTGANGLLHPAIQKNLLKNLGAARDNGFDMVLWANLTELNSAEVSSLRELGVQVKDHSVCSVSRFYPYFTHFLTLGIAGDKSAFALASDILRMAILELCPDDQYYIYFDANDIRFVDLDQNLAQIETLFAANPFGFSFSIMPKGEKTLEYRNDLLIALKKINPDFFVGYFAAYVNNLENEYRNYRKPCTNEEAQDYANRITCQTTGVYFENYHCLTQPFADIVTTFGDFQSSLRFITTHAFLRHFISCGNAGTWYPAARVAQEEDDEAENIYREVLGLPKRSNHVSLGLLAQRNLVPTPQSADVPSQQYRKTH